MGQIDLPPASAGERPIQAGRQGRLRRTERDRHLDWDYLRHWAAEFAQVDGREAMPERLEERKDS